MLELVVMGFEVVIPVPPSRVIVGELAEEEETATFITPETFRVAEDTVVSRLYVGPAQALPEATAVIIIKSIFFI